MSSARTGFLRRFVRRFASIRLRHGTIAALCRFADRLASKALGLCVSHLLCFDLERIGIPPLDTSGFTFRFLTPDDIFLFAGDPANELEADMADRITAGRDVCFAVLAGERLAGYGWCALAAIEPAHTGGIALSFPPHVGYLYKGFTHPDFRGRGLNGIRLALCAQALMQRGLRQLVCLVDWTNWSSLQSCRRIGCRDLGRVITFRFAWRRFWFIPEAAHQLGLRAGDQAELRDVHQITNSVVVAA